MYPLESTRRLKPARLPLVLTRLGRKTPKKCAVDHIGRRGIEATRPIENGTTSDIAVPPRKCPICRVTPQVFRTRYDSRAGRSPWQWIAINYKESPGPSKRWVLDWGVGYILGTATGYTNYVEFFSLACNGFMSEFARIPHSALRNLGVQLVVMPPRCSKVHKSEGWVPLRSP